MKRSLTIQPVIKQSTLRRPLRIYSKILLSGKWLSDAGFNPGSVVNIEIVQNSIIIEMKKGGRK
jgi:hypothetical protein